MLPLTPTKLGRYEILDEIGKGAMGVVYLARDPLIGRLVALKTFRIGFSVRDQEADQFRARFIREAQSAGILSHPNIVTIHDVVEAAGDGLSFIAMEYVRGTNLKMVMQGEPSLAIARVADIISQVAEALDYAHSQRVIHRDVKPANIIITDDGRVKITDFGIARLDTSNLTQEGQLLGTPNYMAPEQVQGKEVDHRADIFALGVVLYEMLTRHKPFQGENLTVVSHRIVYDQFTPLREYARNVPPGVEKIISRALEKDPARRYQRARELAEDLRKLVAESLNGDELNETQSLSSTMVIPAAAVPPGSSSTYSPSPSTVAPAPGAAAAPARKSFWGRLLRGGKDAPPATAAAPAATPTPTSTPVPVPAPVPVAVAPPPPLPAAAPDLLSGSGSQPAVPLVVPMPPPVPAIPPAVDDGSASSAPGMPSATGSSLSVPPPPLAPLAPAPAAVPRPAPATTGGRSGRRLALLGGGIAALLVLGVVLLWAATRMRAPEPVPPPVVATPQPPAAGDEVAKLVGQGDALMRKGDFARAAEVYGQAEQRAPDLPDITRLREEAQKLQVDFQRMVGEEQDVEAKLAEAKSALAQRRYADAIAAAKVVLAARPKDQNADGILKTAQAAEARNRKSGIQLAGGESPAPTPSSEATPAATPSEGETMASAAPQTGRLQMSLHIDALVAKGAVRVYQGTKELWEQPFDVGKGILGRPRGSREFSAGGVEVPAGENQLMIVYAPRDLKEEGEKKVVNVHVPGGATRRVDIRVTQSKKLYAVAQSN